MAEKNEVAIHIDKKEYKSPNPTTGSNLYKLGEVGSDYDLFEEISGQQNDTLIPNNEAEIHLKNGGHFYTVQKN
jgi:hypothetical protein